MDRRFSFQDFGIGLIAGAAVGAIVGILLAPESGESTRERLASGADGVRVTAQDLIDNARDSLELAISRLDGVFGSHEKHLRKRLGALKEELEKYNLSGA